MFKMDFAEALYISELRSGVAGHFSYRRVAWEMYKAVATKASRPRRTTSESRMSTSQSICCNDSCIRLLFAFPDFDARIRIEVNPPFTPTEEIQRGR